MSKQKFIFDWNGSKLDFQYLENDEEKYNKHFDFKKDEKQPSFLLEKATDVPVQVIAPIAPVSVQEAVPVVQEVVPVKVEEVVPALPESIVEAPVAVPVEEAKVEVVSEPVVTVVYADNTEVPTTKVELPAEMPQIVMVESINVLNEIPVHDISTTTVEPQVEVKLADASIKVPDDAELYVLKTPEGNSDVVVAVPSEVAIVAEKVGIDPAIVVEDAIKSEEHFPKLPDLSIQSMPDEEPSDVIPQVVGMTISGDTVHITNVSEKIPDNVSLEVVETPPEMPNIIVGIDPETQKTFEEKGIDPIKELSDYLHNSTTEISTVVKLDENAVADAFGSIEGNNEFPEGRNRWWRRFSDRD